MKKVVRRIKQRQQDRTERKKNDGITTGPVPRITNDTVAAHREEVLGSARKYIYPLKHSKHRIVIVSTTLFIAAIIGFFTYFTLALYRFQSNSVFVYGVSQVAPFPIARIGSDFVAYENYLFELRHYVHYYETQIKLDFNEPRNQEQLTEFKKRALDKVVNDAYVKRIARDNGIVLTDREVDQQIEILRNQNRLGGSDRVFEDVLKDFWGWSVDDFKRSLRQELLAQKVVATLDTQTRARAETVLAQLQSGADFEALAKEHSDDARSRENGGEFGFAVEKANKDLTAQTTEALFDLEEGDVSDLVNTGYALEILKNIERKDDTIRGAHIVFSFADIQKFIDEAKEAQPATVYIRIPEFSAPDSESTPQQDVEAARVEEETSSSSNEPTVE
jgi:hypothetical protein